MARLVNSYRNFIFICTLAIISWSAVPSFAQMCPVTPGTDLITNGDFESSGGFTNDFTLCTSGCNPMPGDQYVIGTNPNTYNSGYFKSMADHTPGAGSNMAIFDFNNASGNDAVYRTTVSVVSGQSYFFSAWFANIAINNTTACGTCPGGFYITNSPQLKFRINGTDVGIVNVDSLTNNWNQFFSTYTAASSGSITIEIINLRTGNSSNDLALDDISFSNGCDKIPNLSTLGQSSALPDTVLICNVNFPYNLNPGLPGSYGYAWKTVPGTTLSTATTYNVPATPASGSYVYLCYSYIAGCPRKDSVLFKTTPLAVNIGADKVICAPVNYNITSNVTVPPVTAQWYKNGVAITGATSASYTATDAGTYRLDISRASPAACAGSASDQMIISNPVSSFAGSGNFCAGSNTASFTITSGTTKVKWYKNLTDLAGTELNPGNTNTTISTTYAATNTTTPGCSSGLYAEDVASFPGTLIPAASIAALPCPPVNGTDNFNGNAATLIEVNQSMTLTSVDFVQNTGWGNTGTFTLTIYTNNPTGGPWCGSCSPAGNYDGPSTTVVYTTSGSYTAASQMIQTMPVANVTLAPGKYWMNLSASGTAMGIMNCNPAESSSNLWTTPLVDNTSSHNVVSARNALKGGNTGSTGALFNMKFQVGSNNACSRLFICATDNCAAPVTFLTVEVNEGNGGNSISWKTASESNNDFFTVERSTDGINFSSVGMINGAGNSNSIKSYNLLDNTYTTNSALIYYRIKQTDKNGDVSYSDKVSIKMSDFTSELKIYPVPVNHGQEINIELPYFSNWNYKIIDVTGKISGEGSVNGHDKISIDSHSLSAGVYVVEVMEGTKLYHGKAVVY